MTFGTQAETKFKDLKVRGLVNKVDIEKLVENQVMYLCKQRGAAYPYPIPTTKYLPFVN